jgi:outer membrane receptor protein involved in Fe transport
MGIQSFRSRERSRVSIALCVAVLLAPHAIAQQATARIVGTIADQQGAVIQGARVSVTNTATNVTTETVTDKSGFYQLLNLPIGIYRIVAQHQDFQRMEVTTVPLEINQSLRVDLKLEVGSVNQQVVVEGQASGVETINPTLGQSITSRPIINMPLNGRNVLSLALLQPGVTDDNPDDASATQGFNIAGGRTDSVTYLLDGGLNNDLISNGVVYNPNPDDVAEFRILTSNYTAEYGRNGAGVISVVTKSGTNQFHGSAFEFLRNTNFDANSYFNIQADLPRNNLKRSQFGGTFGGPLVKNRLFFFTSYQGQRQVQTDVLPEQQTFTTLELAGNFSQAANGGPDPNVAAFLKANPYFQSNPALAAQAILDPSKFDPAAQAYINAKLPNGQSMIPSNATGEFFPSGGSTNNANELTVKIDFAINTKDKLSATIGGNRNPVTSPFGGFLFTTAPGFPSTSQSNTYFLNVAYTRTFSSNMLNELRGTVQRRSDLQDKPVSNFPAIPQFGIASDISTGPPAMEFDNGLIFGQDPYGPTTFAGNTFALADTFTWVRGHNTWKFGAGISAYQQNTLYAFFTNGLYDFAGYGDFGDGTGNSLADFLVGAPNNLFEGPDAANNIRSKTTYGFAQDEWRARPNLTLTLGIRYEYSTPKLDTEGRTFSIIPGDQSVKFPNAPRGLVFPGDPGAPRGVNFPDKKNFAPRIGFAWSPGSNSKTSIRGGFGIFYDVLKGEDNLQFNGAPPFYSEPYVVFPCLTSAADPTCTSAPYTSATPFYSAPWANSTTPFTSNPFPSKPPNPATAFNTCASTGYTCPYYNFLPTAGGSVFFVDPHLRTPDIYQYNLSLQHALASNMVAEVNYVGSSSKGLTSLIDVNPFDLSTISGPDPARILNERQNANITAYCASQGGPSDCPFENADEFGNVAFANFSSLEASLTKQNGANHIIGNTYFTLAYTYGHSIDNASGFRNRDSQVPYYEPDIFRASSDFDVRQRITFSGGWDLPFERAWASGPKRLVKGWSLYPIFSWRTGFPLSINSGLLSSFSPSDPGPSGAGDGYLSNANYAPGFGKITILNPKKQASCSNSNTGLTDAGNLYFNCAAFVAVPDVPGSGYGNTGRDFFRGPGRTNLDLALAKTTAITERVNIEFRVETFNVFNHTQFANPDTNIDDATFGQITSTTLGTGITALQTQRIVQLAGRLTF